MRDTIYCMKLIMEGWRKFTKLNLQEASRFSQDLQNFVDGDQKLRNLFAQEMEKAGGWSQELVNKFVELHGTSKDDVFDSNKVEENFAKLFPKLDFASFSEQDWDNFNVLILHQRKPEDTGLRELALAQMIEAKRWWRDLAADMARSAGLFPELKGKTLSYPEDTQEGGKVDLLLKEKGLTWDEVVKDLLGKSK